MRRGYTISVIQHCLSVLLLCACVWISVSYQLLSIPSQQDVDHGTLLTCLLYFSQNLPILSIPFVVTNVLGIVTMNTFPLPPVLQQPKDDIPFILFRVVTRGLYPELVKRNIERNLETCHKVGLSNFKFEIVTDNALNLKKVDRVRELVVPTEYATPNHSMFKARALHYCTEPSVNIYELEDWIVHLDEETLLTEASTIGLANFASQQVADIGQGVISYANEEIVNWWTTLADSVRVSVDLGMMRFSLRTLGGPVMGFKGSYVIAKEKVEKDIGFDFGPKGSVAEDVFFALQAWGKGYTFNFVEGDMWEKSPFTLADYVKQRKRWFIGHYFALLSGEIPLKCKLCLIPTDLNWALMSMNFLTIVVLRLNNVSYSPTATIGMSIVIGICAFLFMFGAIQSFSLKKYGYLRKTIIIFLNILILPVSGLLDAAASFLGLLTKSSSLGFYIVQKEHVPRAMNQTENTEESSIDIV